MQPSIAYPILSSLDIWVFLQVLARTSTLIAVAPVFAARETPSQVKAALAVVISFVLTPILLNQMRKYGLPPTTFAFIMGIGINAGIGLIMGYTVQLLITAVQMAGNILDVQVGFSMAQEFDPAISETAAPIAQLQSMYAVVLYILAHGHYILLVALVERFFIRNRQSYI